MTSGITKCLSTHINGRVGLWSAALYSNTLHQRGVALMPATLWLLTRTVGTVTLQKQSPEDLHLPYGKHLSRMDSFFPQATLGQGNDSRCQRLAGSVEQLFGHSGVSYRRPKDALSLSHCLGDRHPSRIRAQQIYICCLWVAPSSDFYFAPCII